MQIDNQISKTSSKKVAYQIQLIFAWVGQMQEFNECEFNCTATIKKYLQQI